MSPGGRISFIRQFRDNCEIQPLDLNKNNTVQQENEMVEFVSKDFNNKNWEGKTVRLTDMSLTVKNKTN